MNAEDLRRLVESFYDDVYKHPLLGPVFQMELGQRRETHLSRMVDFWSTVMLGNRSFRGNLVQRHMQLKNVSPAHFDAWIQLWALHTTDRFDHATTSKLRRVAYDIGRQLFASYFDTRSSPHSRKPVQRVDNDG
ncbi:group III truncated hemoglobin [Diaphorobacter aerolatus]|uniref:Group III truncated hemoglobin n=1 Tax=Diaphorobacter aerolatus TaxID=1288495 RepID=A0A7H0GJ66_9BURK|nr:group III truncated hemoglobin [Diaphorobacter aerolatus]QNP48332.1 group III truncated hemoglobin [Diaphorobacter aerolatus]